MKQFKPALSVIAAGILWGVISIFVKTLSKAGIDALQISAVRMILAAICFSLFVLIKDRSKFRIRFRDIWMFIGTGIISIVLFNTCYFYTMIHSQASIAVVLLYTSPVFVMILSAIIFKEKITVIKIIALILTICGCVLVAGLTNDVSISFPVFMIGIASGLFYALYSIFGEIALRRYDTMTVTVWTFIFGLIGSLPLGKVPQTIRIIKSDPKLILFAFGIAILSTVLPYFFYTWGLKRMETSKAAILVAVEPLVGCILGMTIYQEPHNFVKILGIILILASIVLLNIRLESRNT
ncbi:MAG: EamA family transporter [Lachnospiraceae bacterium]|nr:EamA family transporter [Lachnospiraceae bacterium]